MVQRACMAILMVLALAAGAARGETRAAVETMLAGISDRSAGSTGVQKSADQLAEDLASLTHAKVFRQQFELAVPVVDECRAEDPATHDAVPISPLLPSGAQIAAVKASEAEAPLIYAGKGTLAELRGKDIPHAWVALELDCAPSAWQTAAMLGAKGILFLGDAHARNTQFLEKTTTVPIGIPRFYCDDPAALERIRTAQTKRLSIHVNAHWEQKPAENLICIIPGRGATDIGAAANWTTQSVILQARYDATSQVLTRAPGATTAANAQTLVALAGKIAAAAEHRTTIILLTAGDAWNLRGSRAFLDLLKREDIGDDLVSLEADVRQFESRRDAANHLLEGLQSASTGDIQALHVPDVNAAIEDELALKISANEAAMDIARAQNDSAAVGKLTAEKESLMAAIRALSATKPPESIRKDLADIAAQLLPRWKTETDRLDRIAAARREWVAIRAALPEHDPMLWVSLAITAGRASDHFGFFSRSAYSDKLNAAGRMTVFLKSLQIYSTAGAAPIENFELRSMQPAYTLETFFPVPLAFSSDAAIARGQPAGAFATIGDPAPEFDTPLDTPDHINWQNLAAQSDAIEKLLLGNGAGGMLTDPLFYTRVELPVQTADQELTLFERTLAETIPHIGAAHCLVGGEADIGTRALGDSLTGTRRTDWYLTDARGQARISSAPRFATTRLQAFEFDPDGTPLRTLIANQSDVRGLVSAFTPDARRPVRAMLFDCARLDVPSLFDPRHLDTLDSLTVLDARRLDNAQFTNIYLDDHVAAAFFPPHLPWQLLGSKGALGTRLVLINADESHPRGTGFTSTDLAGIGPMNDRSARDLAALDKERQHDLEKFGISNEVIKELQAASTPQQDAIAQARTEKDYPAWFSAADALWSLQQQVHDNLIETSDGIIRGVIFLLLGIVPFSFFLERLLIGSSNVYRQIIWFAVIFAAMTAGLWFHPAFRISSMPLMILLAFLIITLSATVVYILWGKFEDQIAQLRGPAAQAHSTSLRRAAVFGAAIRLGLSNMRRRGTRTGLTLATLVILTFTLLCFTSVRESVQVSPREIALPATPPPGVLIRQRAWRELPSETLRYVEEIAPAAPVAPRWMIVSDHPEQPWQLPLRGDHTFYATALVGLDPAESQFQGADITTILKDFDHLAAAPDLCWLPAKLRDEPALAFHEGQTVNLLGHTLTVAGFFETDAFLKLRQLTGDPLAPPDPSAISAQPGGNRETSNAPAVAEPSYRTISPDSLVVISAPLARELGGKLTSIMVQPPHKNPDDAVQFARSLAQRSDFTLYVSDGARTLGINAATSTEPKDLSTVLVPMIIAGVIVLNTMLGAVGERTREIHVYTSVGLAPSHVGMLFLAEAAALGTLGVVFGYIFGQGLATVLSWTNFLPGVDLNYSSMSAIITMGLVLGVVMVSALWPAHAATRLAAPSLQREWKLPRPVGDLLSVNLPFTVNESAAKGVCAFIEEFLQTTTQSGTGHFTADQEQIFLDDTPFGPVRGIAARIWLAPYDLGVIQTMELSIHPTGEHNVFDVHLEITREAGNPAAWHRLNRPFLTEIRKQFLLWRNLDPTSMHAYITRAEKLFDHQPAQPPKNTDRPA